MINLLALYRGENLRDTKTITVTSDPRIIKSFAREILERKNKCDDPSLSALSQGEKSALSLILEELGS